MSQREWEYLTKVFDAPDTRKFDEELDAIGVDGWELVNFERFISNGKTKFLCVFKKKNSLFVQ